MDVPGNRAIAFSRRIAYGRYRVTRRRRPTIGRKAGATLYRRRQSLAAERLRRREGRGLRTHRRGRRPTRLRAIGLRASAARQRGYGFDVPLLAGDHVTEDAGTGFVHTAPGHGREDFELWMASGRLLAERGIDTRIPYTVDENGAFTDEAPGFDGQARHHRQGREGRRQRGGHQGADRGAGADRARQAQAPISRIPGARRSR